MAPNRNELAERGLLDFSRLAKKEQREAIAPLMSLSGDLGAHLKTGRYTGIVFGWRSLAELAGRYKKREWLFRGHTEPQPEMMPAIGRAATIKPGRPYSLAGERQTLESFKLRARSYLQQKPENDFEWLAIGRHYGLPTRLLDWTESFLVAVMFACLNSGIHRGKRKSPELCAIRNLTFIDGKSDNVFELKEVVAYRPPHISVRIPAQQGVFTIHPSPDVPYVPDEVERWLFWSDECFNIKKMLDVCGINESTLFPEIEGLAKYLAWVHKWGIAQH